MKKVIRYFLEIFKKSDLIFNDQNLVTESVKLINIDDFKLNKFFYKNIGKSHGWKDRLNWSDKKWIEYTSSKNVITYVLKYKNDFAGYFELIFHQDKKEIEIAYLGILEEYQNKKLGSYLLSEAIKKSFNFDVNRVWVHTCTLDHRNALNNYKARGMTIFKTETLNI